MSRPRRQTAFAANPFVAFADLSIALAFIFALCTIALSKALSDITRDQRQTKIQKGFSNLMQTTFHAVDERPAGWTRTTYDKRRNIVLYRDGIVGRLSTNGSYQRIELSKGYDFGATETNNPTAYLQLGEIVRQAMSHGDIAYVFLHGIVEEGEPEAAHCSSGRELAQLRTDGIFRLWRSHNLIAGEKEPLAKPDHPDFIRIDPQYVVNYGKDGLYRNTDDADFLNKTHIPGRVDVVLFYTDKTENGANPVR